MNQNIKQAFIKAAVVLVPTYIVAYTTQKMIYVVPMLAASAYVAAAMFGDIPTRKVDDDVSKDGIKDSKDDIDGTD